MSLIFTKDFGYHFSSGTGRDSARNTSQNTRFAKFHIGTYWILRDTLSLPKVKVEIEQPHFGKVDALHAQRRSLTFKCTQYLHKAW